MAQRWKMLETEPPEDRLRRQLQELEEEVCSILPLMYWPYAEEGYQCTKLITTSIERVCIVQFGTLSCYDGAPRPGFWWHLLANS